MNEIMNEIEVDEVKEVYNEDTFGRRYRIPVISKKGTTFRELPPGEIISVNLNKPIERNEFKKLSDDLKVLYIKNLREKYGVTLTDVAEMLGYNVSHFSTVVSSLNLKGLFKSHKKPSKRQLADWRKFLKGEDDSHNKEIDIVKTKPEMKVTTSPLAMFCNCSFTLKGALNISDIASKIQSMVADGTPCSISISIDAIADNQ